MKNFIFERLAATALFALSAFYFIYKNDTLTAIYLLCLCITHVLIEIFDRVRDMNDAMNKMTEKGCGCRPEGRH